MQPLPLDPNVALWSNYEEAVTQLNSLIMAYRLQVIAGTAAVGTAVSYLINRNKLDDPLRNWHRAVLSSGVTVLLLAAVVLDLGYYNLQLRGAVNALLAFERSHPGLQLGTEIEKAVGGGQYAIYAAYGVMLGGLGAFSLSAWRDHFSPRSSRT